MRPILFGAVLAADALAVALVLFVLGRGGGFEDWLMVGVGVSIFGLAQAMLLKRLPKRPSN